MNLKEAYSILELPSSATPEEAKKRYREFTKKYHPDVNKEPGAEDKFKKINEAYQIISSGKGGNAFEFETMGYSPFKHVVIPEHISIETHISFKESVLGCKKEIKFNRDVKCQNCNGEGEVQLNNGCDKCGGRGVITGRHGTMLITQTCSKCQGRTNHQDCKVCISKGSVSAETVVTVTIPGGIKDNNILRLANMGHYIPSGDLFGLIERYTDVHMYVRVSTENGLTLEGNDVISHLDISLLEALKGCKKVVKTISGYLDIDIKPKSKNKDDVIISKLGVNGVGDHKVILNVEYPSNIETLIDVLSHKEN